MVHILDCLHAEVWGVQVCGIQLLQVEDGPHAASLLGDEEDGNSLMALLERRASTSLSM
jgi:hypothetical protein